MLGLLGWLSEDIDITVFREDLKQAASIEDMEKLSGKKRRAKLDAIRDACAALGLRDHCVKILLHTLTHSSLKMVASSLIRRMRTGKRNGLVSDDSCVPIRLCTAGRSN
jgi:hypothetical protein